MKPCLFIKLVSYSLLACSIYLHLVCISFAQTAVIGGPEAKSNFSLLDKLHPLSFGVNDLVCCPLFRTINADVTLELASSIKVDQSSIRFYINTENKFSNGKMVTDEDVIWSLNYCLTNGQLEHIEEVLLDQHNWPNSSIVALTKNNRSNNLALIDIANCPIIEKYSSSIFGEDLGHGTNLICSGDYKISDYRFNNYYKLEKNRQASYGADIIEMKFIASSEEGLRLLRTGDLQLYFTDDHAILDRANQDPTLKTGKCQTFSYAARHDFSLPFKGC